MIICICNNLSSDDIQRAVDAGCKTFDEVLEYNDVVPGCFSCEFEIQQELNKTMAPVLQGVYINSG